MNDDLNNYVQDIETNSEDGVQWANTFEEETLDNEDLKSNPEKKSKEEKEETEIEIIQKSIEQQQEEVKKLQEILNYYESGAAYRENESLFGSGNITEKEFFDKKSVLDAELEKAKLDLNDATVLLQELVAKKAKITGVIDDIQLEQFLEKNRNPELEGINEKIQQQEEEMEKTQEVLDYYESGVAYRENESLFGTGAISEDEFFAKKDVLDKELEKARDNRNNATNSLQDLLDKKGQVTGVKSQNNNNKQNTSSVQGEQFNGINNGVTQDSQEKYQEPSIDPNKTQQLDLYRKQNAFMSLVRKVMAKIKSFGGRADTDKMEKVVSEEMNRQAASFDTASTIDENALGDSLAKHVCSKEEIIDNINKRESLEKDEIEVKKNIDDVTI